MDLLNEVKTHRTKVTEIYNHINSTTSQVNQEILRRAIALKIDADNLLKDVEALDVQKS